jgi:hypothetical protein
MAQTNGTNFTLQIDTDLIFGETTSEMQFSTDVFETTVKSSTGRKKTFESGEHGFTGSASMIVSAADGAKIKAIIDHKDAGVALPFVFGGTAIGDFKIEGNVILTSANVPAPKNEARTIDIEFQGTGNYTVTVITA